MNSMKKQKDTTPKHEPPMSEGVQQAIGKEQKAVMNSFRKNEAAGPKQKQHLVVDVSGGESKDRCCKEQYCIGTWNVRSLNQGKSKVGKQVMARINIDVLGIRELQ